MAWGHAAAESMSRTGVGGSNQRNMGFVPSIWSGRILKSIDDKLVTGKLCNRDYEGFIKGKGDSVRVHRMGNIIVQPYSVASRAAEGSSGLYINSTTHTSSSGFLTGTTQNSIEWQVLDGASTVVSVDQADYFAFEVEDIEKAQADPNYIAQASARAGYALASAAERYNLYKMLTASQSSGGTAGENFGQAGGTYAQTNNVHAIDASGSSSVYDGLVELGVLMDDFLCPDTGRYLIAPSFVHANLLKDTRFVGAGADGSGKMRDNGYIGRVAGFDIYTLSRQTMQSYDAGNTGTMVKNDTITDVATGADPARTGRAACRGAARAGAPGRA